eukprot:4699063-Amphidinium_carterae.1
MALSDTRSVCKKLGPLLSASTREEASRFCTIRTEGTPDGIPSKAPSTGATTRCVSCMARKTGQRIWILNAYSKDVSEEVLELDRSREWSMTTACDTALNCGSPQDQDKTSSYLQHPSLSVAFVFENPTLFVKTSVQTNDKKESTFGKGERSSKLGFVIVGIWLSNHPALLGSSTISRLDDDLIGAELLEA